MQILANIDCKFEGQFSVPPEILIEKIKDSTNAVLFRCKNEDDRTFHRFYLQALQHFVGEKRVKKEVSNLKIFSPEEFVTQFVTLMEVIPCITNHANGYHLIFTDFNITIRKIEDPVSRKMFPHHLHIDDQCIMISSCDLDYLKRMTKYLRNEIQLHSYSTSSIVPDLINSTHSFSCLIPTSKLRQLLNCLFENSLLSPQNVTHKATN